jgi:hypothetical protein
MSTPTVTEITRRPEPVVHDTFIDDLAPRAILVARPPRRER